MKEFYYSKDIDLSQSNIIYKLTNQINNKVYIGQTIQTMRRRLCGYRRLEMGQLLKRAILKYGFINFELTIIEECSNIDILNNQEEYWVAYFESTNPKKGYNLQPGGNNKSVHPITRKYLSEVCSGWTHTEEAKRKISESQKGDKHWSFGKSPSKETRNKMSESHKGQVSWNKGKKGYYTHTDEAKKKMSNSQKGRIITWGDKITEAKIKFHKEDILAYIRENPSVTMKDIMNHFNIKSRSTIHKMGGLKQLKREVSV